MSGSTEVRQFLMRYDGAESSGQGANPGIPTQRAEHADNHRISDEQVRRARLAVAMGSHDSKDCALLLEMLGLLPETNGGLAPVQR